MDTQYTYQQPQETFTIDQFISCQSDSAINYNNLSFLDIINEDNIVFNTYNVLSDYIDEIRDKCVLITLNEEQMYKYKYRPKLLCYDIYGNSELAFVILVINDMYNAKNFTKNKILMLNKTDMNDIMKYIYNSNKQAISDYNDGDK